LPPQSGSQRKQDYTLSTMSDSLEDLIAQGYEERKRHHLDTALACYEEAVAILRTRNDQLRLAHTVRHVADILCDQDRESAAMPHYEEALAIYRAHPSASPLDLANAIRGYALLLQKLKDTSQVVLLWQEARKLYADTAISAGVQEADRRLAALAQN
jgi:tetratricopeptide (TPR) repeat protein